MKRPREARRVGLDYLESVTALLQRGRALHPTEGAYDAAEIQWWWGRPRPTDELPQLFWFDADDLPVAAAVVTAWSDRTTVDPIVLPGSPSDLVVHVMERGLEHAHASGFDTVGLEVGRMHAMLRDFLSGRGFEIAEAGLTESWLAADDRPPTRALHEGYRLTSRAETADRPHPMIERNGPHVEERLQQTSLYRPDLDLVVLGPDDEPAARGLFWFDPTTMTGVVEPMRTADAHQRRGLARHVLTAGTERLAALGVDRVKICFEPGNRAASHLYLDVGFVPVRENDYFVGPTG